MSDTNGGAPGRAGGLGGMLHVAASLVWLPQAAVIAWVLAALLAGRDSAPLLMAAIFAGLGGLRALLNARAQDALSAAATARIAALRAEVIAAEAATALPSSLGGAGAIAALAAEKTEALRPFLMRYRPARLRVMVLPPVILAIAAWHSWAVAAVLLMAGPLIPVFMALVGWAAKEASARQMVEIGALSDLLVDRLAALSDLRLIGAAPPVIAGFAEASDNLRGRTMAVLRIAFLSSTVLELFAALGVAMVAVWVGFALLGEIGWGTWGSPLSPFAGIFLLLLAPDYFQPLRDLAAAWHDKSAADAVTEELDRWRDQDRAGLIGSGHGAVARPFAGLSTRALAVQCGPRRIAYPDLDIAPGESLALTGPSGVGKTTLLRLLAGLEPPAQGRILCGDTALDGGNADAWRAALGWMPQAPHFLDRSLRHNIGFGAPLRPDVLDTARVTPVIDTLPRGDLTVLGERGAGLSGGEARRVMLARALHGRPALLLADEPTADLDAQTAQDIVDGLLRFVEQGGTLIAATHDPRLIARLGREIRLEDRG
ncbi:ABC transporter ATP-binding protein/permease [Actibacterium ureilyticum]|uniref:ABC transporter ATP-binding protein/permease n=1 Tax=Actibacterium ureilyticum TaxID=1590614 RepID=UPI001FEA594F|nr:ATP-binding cassette domain-containing protein [Actibacterium ureilyticum]